MTKIKLTKNEKEKIRLVAKNYERELLLQRLTSLEDENIIDLINEALVTVKMIYSEEIVDHVKASIKLDEESLLQGKQRAKDRDGRDIEKNREFQDYFGKYGSTRTAGLIRNWGCYNSSSLIDIYIQSQGLNLASTIWKTDNSSAGGTGLAAVPAGSQSNMSITKLSEQIQIINDNR